MKYFNYFSEIEAAFIRRRGRNLLLSPLDWELIESWKEKEIPLHIVLRAIEDVFDAYDKKPNKRRAIKSLTYCRDEVDAQYEEWLDSQVGKVSVHGGSEFPTIADNVTRSDTELFSDASVGDHLKRVSGEFGAAVLKLDGGILDRLVKVENDLKSLVPENLTTEDLERRLEELDSIVDGILAESIHADRVSKDLTRKMAEYREKMDSESYARTFDLMLQKQLRDETGIPRFSLFHL